MARYPLLFLGLLLCFPASAQEARHWAFARIKKVAPPAGARHPIDAFLLEQQQKLKIVANPEVTGRVLLRRLFLDLTGLPPTMAEVEAFEKDTRPDAYAQAVEHLLASPQYGERWARHWLDVARWAESEGYESNHPRAFAWRYRDWVVNALNNDKLFRDFVREQIAGDEITPYADDNLIATGFLAGCRLSSNEEDRWRQRNDMTVDIVNATASTFLGLTLQCAQCHKHRLDPISASDYYRFYAFFVQGQPGNLALKNEKLWAEYNAKKPAGYDEAIRERDRLFEKGRQAKHAQVRKTLSAPVLAALDLPMEKRSPEQERMAREADLMFQFTAGGFENALDPDDLKRYKELKKQVADMELKMVEKPQTFGFYSSVTSPNRIDVWPMKGFYPLRYEHDELRRAKAYVLKGGDVHQPGEKVQAGWPEVLGKTPLEVAAKPTRLALADWLTSPDNPLTARVYVNRLWHWHFGRGIVATPSDFGVKGAPPTNQDLLDWLAGELLRTGSTKHIHRLIVTSSAYRRLSAPNKDNEPRDPENKTWWRWEPRRLEAEAIRDSMLAVAGELDRTMGGASHTGKEESRRRSLYLFQKRDVPPVAQGLFDGPTAITEGCPCRRTTTVPLQALYLLNSEFSSKRGEALARQVAKESDREKQAERAFRLVLQRVPDDTERSLARRFFEAQGESPAALARFCQALLNVNEFVYVE